ncbi:MAG: hypothetical protein D6750_09415, partial [Bacteroidetes bacterium]
MPFKADTNLHLVATSASSAINAGSIAYNGTQDFDGETRPIPNPGPGSHGDPGTAPDIGADELDGIPFFTCAAAVVAPNLITSTPPNAGSDYLWGTPIQLDTTGTLSPTASGVLQVIYSLDGGATWTAGPTVGAFPVSFTLPPLAPPTYTGTIRIAIRASQAPGCPPLPDDTSDAYLALNLTDRPGNRPANAIPITLTDNGNGTWSVVVRDSTNGPGISNEYGSGDGTTPRGTGAPELFFKLTLPACFDSLEVHTCAPYTNFDTYVSLLHDTDNDTIVSDDGCTSGTRSRIIAIGRANSQKMYTGSLGARPARDTMRLQAGDELYIVVEGYYSYGVGAFELSVTGYKQRLQPVISGVPTSSVCVSQGTVSLQATGATGAGAYEWEINGTVDGANTTNSYS